ncbi:FK506-binding protein 15 [Tyrophagus putrescentiae]|nr:FK506-binding protein 15 [Tyrophagus putrescentiae]
MISLETDDDKEEFNISAGKNLSRLFDDDQPGSTEQSKSALFYRPKQNRKPTTESSEKSRSGSLSSAPAHKLQAYAASAVDVYKLDQGKYVYVGKLGIALMGPSSPASNSESITTFRLILYTAKNQPIAGATITEKFKFVCQADNYCSFYDDAQHNWSIRFSAAADVTRFAVQIAHAHFGVLLSSKKKKKTTDLWVVQSLTPVSTNSSLSLPSEHRLLTDFVVTFELTVRGFAQGEHSLISKEPLIEKKVTELRITTESSPPLLKLLFTPSSSDSKCLEQSKWCHLLP